MASGEDIGRQIESLIVEASKVFDEPTMLEIGHLAQNIITLRTKKGLDADRVPFAPYTRDYAKWRASKGRSSTTVDLAFTGHTQGAEIVTVKTNETTIAFGAERQAQIAAYLNDGTKKMAKREWFDVRHPDEIDVIEDVIGAKIQGRLEKIR